ncbi:aromatic amino acid hydroxylase [Haliea sp. E1-2-M8]|uniref:aromatic amino acid hydroxylase n=1 Tax=Haliea sp. E1-2-M8 TaxID=3064706 RepID=UPI002724B350|nr:aromatic amino acid hydroxylase [Haliea sp. E1-2-M8]MDO8860617.1 aromatic amino acid hydroxylase [Haliea sp. E1-2-M8]
MTQQEIVASLPAHLRPFVQLQEYAQYTPRDQAVWRFIMRQLTRRLRDTAHPVYLEGLARTGIALDHIPSVDEMNACLAQLGWRAVVVDGFIPPAIFMEFQALKVLVIALEMRSVEHIFYTPAPDIVHESAGHAPFLVDVDYAEFLQRFGEIGMKAIATHQDFVQYEAVRHLSMVKEAPASTAADIAAAELALEEAMAVTEEPSEAALLTRLHWWTVEYGLVGELEDYHIFGAGLLSSLGESRHCLDDQQVRKLPLTVDAVTVPYDITREQPQLFVSKSCRHLSQVLEEFAAAMCFQRGGAESLRKAIAAGTVCTARYDSGVQVSGQFVEVLCDSVGKAVYLQTTGPTQLAWRDTEIYGHGTAAHAEGFGSPVGRLKDFSRCLSEYSVDELRAHHIVIGEPVVLEFLSGITVRGRLQHVLRQDQRNLLLSFADCTVTDLQGRILFEPAWGQYDMAVGAFIDSVYGGTADRERYQLYKAVPVTAAVRPAADATLQELYRQLADLAAGAGAADLATGLAAYPDEWLLRVEVLAAGTAVDGALRQGALADLQRIADAREDLREVIGLALEAAA